MHGITHAWHDRKSCESSPCAWGHAPGAMRHAINVRAQYDYCYNIYFINHLSVQTLPCHDRLALKS
jgi:hypothetical protein